MIKFSELGTTGLKRNAGIIQEEYLRELRGDKWIKTIKQMSDQNAIVGAILLTIELMLRQTSWDNEPVDESAAAMDVAEFINECLDDMSHGMEDTMSEILTMLPFGWSFMEIVYKHRTGDSSSPRWRSKYTDGRIGWRKWSIRSQDTLDHWQFDDNGGLQGMWQRADGKPAVMIPIEKALLFRTSTRKGNPEGKSVLRSAYTSYYYATELAKVQAIGVERDAAGLPKIGVPPQILSPDATAAEISILNMFKEIGMNIRVDEQACVIYPLAFDDKGNKMFEIELMASPGAKQFDIDAIIERNEQRIAMAILADFILLGHESVGSYALSATKSSLFKTALTAWLDSIADVINTHAIPRLLELNGIDVALAPKFTFGRVGDVELEDLIAFVERTTRAGMTLFPDVEIENHLRNEVGLAPLTEDDIRRREEEKVRKDKAAEQALLPQPGQPGQPAKEEKKASE